MTFSLRAPNRAVALSGGRPAANAQSVESETKDRWSRSGGRGESQIAVRSFASLVGQQSVEEQRGVDKGLRSGVVKSEMDSVSLAGLSCRSGK